MFEPDGEAGVVDEVQDRDVEEIAEVEVAGQLAASVRRQRAAVGVLAVRGDDAHGMAVETREPGHLVRSPQRADFEERVPVRHQADGLAHIERGRSLAGDQREQFLVAPIRRVVGARGCDWRGLVDARRQVGQESAGQFGGFFLGLREVVHRAVAAVDVPAAEILLGDVVAHGMLDDRRAGDEQLRDVAHHHRKVAEHGLRGADTDDAAEQHVDHGHRGQLLGVHGTAEVPRQERTAASGNTGPAGLDGAAALLRRALALGLLFRNHGRDAATAGRTVQQADGRQPQLQG